MGANYLFTSQNAAEMARKSHETRKARQQAIIQSIQEARDNAATESLRNDAPTFADIRLTRVRAQLNTLDSELEAELAKSKPDARRVKELIDAQYRLAEQERFLDGRPAPGQFRPELKRQVRGSPRLAMDTTITVVEQGPTEQTTEKLEDTKTSPLG